MLGGYAISREGRSTGILLSNEDANTKLIIEEVDKNLRRSKYYDLISQIDVPTITSDIIDDLGKNGLNPVFYKHRGYRFKKAFIKKLIPDRKDPDFNARSLTAKLLIETLKQGNP